MPGDYVLGAVSSLDGRLVHLRAVGPGFALDVPLRSDPRGWYVAGGQPMSSQFAMGTMWYRWVAHCMPGHE